MEGLNKYCWMFRTEVLSFPSADEGDLKLPQSLKGQQ